MSCKKHAEFTFLWAKCCPAPSRSIFETDLSVIVNWKNCKQLNPTARFCKPSMRCHCFLTPAML